MSHSFRILKPARQDPGKQDPRLLEEFRGRCAFAVMAKAPVPGKVKTRLSPPLTPSEAAGLNASFLRDTLESLGKAAQACAASPVVSYTPTGQEEAFSGILPDGTLLVPQRGESFDERLLATVQDLLLCGFSAVCLIDSDSPTVPTGEFVHAAKALLPAPGQVQDHVVLGLSEDGGYYLLGITQPHARLFEEISWSTELVGAQTGQRAAELALPVTRLATWFDVDDAASLGRLRRELDGDPATPRGYAAPHTAAFLNTLRADTIAGEVQETSGSAHGHG